MRVTFEDFEDTTRISIYEVLKDIYEEYYVKLVKSGDFINS